MQKIMKKSKTLIDKLYSILYTSNIIKREKDMTIKLTPRKKLFVETAAEMYGNGAVISKDQIRFAAEKE